MGVSGSNSLTIYMCYNRKTTGNFKSSQETGQLTLSLRLTMSQRVKENATMAKKPPSARKKQEKVQTWKDYVVIGIYILLALALVIPLVTSLFGVY